MKRKTYILLSLTLIAIIAGLAGGRFFAGSVAAQKSEDLATIGAAAEYNATSEFSLTQGGTSGVWRYGYTTTDASNAFAPYTLNATNSCNGAPAEGWTYPNSGDGTPVIYRYGSPAGCNGTPPDSLFVHPGPGGERAVLRWVAPQSGTYQLTGALQRANPSATTDIRIIKNETTSLFTGNVNSVYQQAFNLTVTVAANDTVDFSVGYGNGVYFSDGSSLNATVREAVTACLSAPANLEVNVPAENSPSDVESVNTNASLAGDATYTNSGKVGRAFEFDGAGDYVRIEDNAAQRPATAVTVEGWFKFDSVGGIASLISKPVRGSALNSYTLYLEGGQLRGLVGNASQYTRALSSFSPQTGVWHHLAFTYDYAGGVSTLKLYANGVEVTSGVDGTPNLPLFYDANPFPLLVGGEYENNAPGFFLDGQADEVAVYGRALSQSEIFDIVQQGSFGKCPNAPCAQAPQGLISWYQGENNALDAKSNNHGALFNGTTFQNGKVGQGIKFDGVDDLVEIPDSPSLKPQTLTVETWVKFNSLTSTTTGGAPSGYQNIVFKKNSRAAGTGFEGGYSLVKNPSDVIGFGFNSPGGGTDFANSTTIVQPGMWYHIVGTHDGTTIKLYVNGQLEGTGAVTFPIDYGTTPLYLGNSQVPFSGYFNGVMDETSIYNRALTAAEISSVYNAGSSGKCKPVAVNPAANLVGFWTGDGDARDFAGEDQNATNNGVGFKVGKVGQSFNFTADPQNVSIPDSPAGRPANFTVEAWTKSLDNGGTRHIFAKTLGTGTSDSYVFWINNGVLNGAICAADNNCSTISTAAPNAGEWHHLALSFDDATDSLRIFIDGVQAASGATSLSIGYDAHAVLIGADYANEVISDSWRGQLDEVSFYDRALTPPEIAAVYNAGTAGKLKAKTVSVLPPLTAKTAKGSLSAQSLLAPASVQLSDATVTFADLTSGGTVSENAIDLANLPPLPSAAIFTGLAYDISTNAAYQNGSPDDVRVCFNLPALASVANLRILHLENNVWVNRTATGGSFSNLCTDDLASLSPFVIVQSLAPTAARVTVAGKVADAFGTGLGGVSVTLTDSLGRSTAARTNSFGRYSFAGVAAGDVYTVSVASKRYEFAVSSQVVNVEDALENVDFTAIAVDSPISGKTEMR